ncbi:hypothetical protein ACC702_03720 [Rhizobium ruizarguesonis]
MTLNVSVPAASLYKVSMAVLEKLDYGKMQEIAQAVAENPSLLSDFTSDPEKTAKKINGFEVPQGFHMHVADGANAYYPPEDDALSQISGQEDHAVWSRIEVRAGYGMYACIVCLWCKAQ